MAKERQTIVLPAPEDNVKPLDYKEQFQVCNFPVTGAWQLLKCFLLARAVMCLLNSLSAYHSSLNRRGSYPSINRA
jgi:hypothetical protein